MSSRLPDELLARCAGQLDLPSAGRLAQASRAGQRLVLVRLVEAKAERAAALAEAAAPPPVHGVALTAAGKAFIDAHVDPFIGTSSAGREKVIEHIISAATGDEHLSSTNWTAVIVAFAIRIGSCT